MSATVDLLYQMNLPTVQSKSPLNLSPKGEEVEKAIRAKEKIAIHWDEIKKKIEEKNPKNPYDIQTVFLDVASDCFEKIFTAEEKNEIKNYAFTSGVNLLIIFPVLGIRIRDKFLEEKQISIKEIEA